MGGYITQDDLANALGAGTFLAIFDDSNQGRVPDDAPNVALVLRRAHAEVASYLPRIFTQMPDEAPMPTADLLFAAELDFAVSFAFERHPEYVRFYGEDKRSSRFERARARMERIAEGIQQIPPNDPAAPPVPAGGVITGGIVTDNSNRMIIDSADGTKNGGDFA